MKFKPLNAKVKYENLDAVLTAIEELYQESLVNMRIPEKTRKKLQELKLKAHELKKIMEV